MNPNTLGLSSALAFLFGAYILRGVKRIALCVPAFALIVLSLSRGAMFALVLSTVVALLLRRLTRIPKGPAWIVTGLLLLVPITPLPQWLEDQSRVIEGAETWTDRLRAGAAAVSRTGHDDNFDARLDAWVDAIAFSKSYPAGTLGPPQRLFGESIDNEYLRLWCQGGGLAVLIFCVGLWYTTRLSSSSREGQLLTHSAALIAFAGGSAAILTTPPIILYWFTLGGTLATRDGLPAKTDLTT